MKILTLWEPWASLMARGYKKWETRCWRTHYRGPVAIHAAKTDRWAAEVVRLIRAAGYDNDHLDRLCLEIGQWPLGKIIAIGNLVDCVPTERAAPSDHERVFGDYSPERFAWVFEDIRRVEPRVFKGQRGLRDLPDGVAQELKLLDEAA